MAKQRNPPDRHFQREVRPVRSPRNRNTLFRLWAAATRAHGFSLPETLIASCLVALIGAAAFGMLGDLQQTASIQADMQSALEGTIVSLDMVGRFLRQAGNDPRAMSFTGIAAFAVDQIRVRADCTGSAAPGNPDKGDADGDTDDAYEDIVIRRDRNADTIVLVTAGGGAQTVAENISGLALQFFDSFGNETISGSGAARARITVNGSCRTIDPRTRRPPGLRLSCDILLQGQR